MKNNKLHWDNFVFLERNKWTVQFNNTDKGWTWSAVKNIKTKLESAETFKTLRDAKKDYEQAIGG